MSAPATAAANAAAEADVKMAARLRTYGLCLALTGVIIVSPDSLMLRYARSYAGDALPVDDGSKGCVSACGLSDARLWTTLMVKNCFQWCIFANVFVAFNARLGRHAIWRGITEAPVSIAVSSVLQAMVNVLFPLSLLETTSARALMFISVNPLWAAVMGRVVLKEKMEWPTLVALAVALGAIALVFVPSLVEGSTAGENDGSVRGDIISLVCGTCVAAFLTANRRAASRHPKALMSVAGMTGCFLSALLCLPPALSLQLGSHVHTLDGHHAGAVHLNPGPGHAFADLEPLFWPLILTDSAMVVGCVVTAMTLAPRYISATQVALLLLLENILGPLIVYISPQFREVPSVWTLAGGGLLLTTLALHEVALWHMRTKREAQRKRTYYADAAGEPARPSDVSANEAPAKAPSEPQRRFRPVRWRALRGVAVPAVEDGSDEGTESDALDRPPAASTVTV